MRYLKYFTQLNEGHITLTSDEHKAVEKIMPKLKRCLVKFIKPIKGELKYKDCKNLIDSGSKDIIYVDTIKYVSETGLESKVGIYVVDRDDSFAGEFLGPQMSKEISPYHPGENIILMNQRHLNAVSEQKIRSILIHELIHAKDPKLNQYFTNKYKKSSSKKNYMERRHEFEAFTGQLLNIISNSTYKFLKEGWSSKELKNIFDNLLEHFKDTLSDYIDYYLSQPDSKVDTYSVAGRKIISPSQNYPDKDKYQQRSELLPNTILFLNRESKWDKNKFKLSIDYMLSNTEFEEIAYDLVSSVDFLKQVNSDYVEFLKDLYKEISKQVEFVNSKREEKIELNYKTMIEWIDACKNTINNLRSKFRR